jgi:A/G-specific adenine glycosylase
MVENERSTFSEPHERRKPFSEDDIAEFQRLLLSWFEKEQRLFPWRLRLEPYEVLVAEKLLQQTAARPVVIKAYEELLRRYPNPKVLAAAKQPDLEELVRPLGFVYRAADLLAMAQALVERHQGKVPGNLKELLALPGVGDYAARAVLSFAFGEDVPVVDTNIARFLYRLYGIPGRLPFNPARKKSLIELAASLVPAGRSKEWNLAILDLCALICKPSTPLCSSCPVQPYCNYGSEK